MDGGTWYHPQACATLGLKHRLHSFNVWKKYRWKSNRICKEGQNWMLRWLLRSMYKERKDAILHVYQWMIDDIIHLYDAQCSKIAT